MGIALSPKYLTLSQNLDYSKKVILAEVKKLDDIGLSDEYDGVIAEVDRIYDLLKVNFPRLADKKDPGNAVITNFFSKIKSYIDDNVDYVTAHYEINGKKSIFELDIAKLSNIVGKSDEIIMKISKLGDGHFKVIYQIPSVKDEFCKERLSLQEIGKETEKVVKRLNL